MSARLAPRLDLELADLPWVLGPTDSRPAEQWLPEAHALFLRLLDLEGERDDERRATLTTYVRKVLDRVAAPDGALPYRIVRWLSIDEPPLVASFGISESGDDAAYDAFLGALDSGPVEPAVIEDLGAPPGIRIRRGLAYSQPDTAVFVELRYLVQFNHTDEVVLLTVGARSPVQIAQAQPELDALVATMRLSTEDR